ncbi:hypothetical protein DKT77_17160 [Meridianimarinicoccus roseus]|jgi:hypothetical protein|uniref:Acyloxyacyl hydrolase n=1 Tax=Meridianimarinicoccus roseus TaxID=2072018 RepID=A0A2V2LD29_9RHOB|nr:hypothetical protein [Meridianimarinicoccus roseus]PWR01434.1 hypothetical protein DKT77_17160 [Meridianimarinicoccus roseus]
MRFRSPKRWATGCSRRADAFAAALALCAAVLAPPADAEARNYASAFAGQMTDNEWGELFDNWGAVRWRDATQVGVGASREWRLGRFGFFGAEAQVLKHFGEQTHVELTAPLFLRTPRPSSVFLPSFAYGLGLSYGTEPSKTEIARTGESTELLAHWFFELEFGNDESLVKPYLRLHHRSHAWETFDARTGSNAVLIGMRLPLDRLLR